MSSNVKTGSVVSVPSSLINQLQGMAKPVEASMMAAPQVPAPGPSPRPTPSPAPVAT